MLNAVMEMHKTTLLKAQHEMKKKRASSCTCGLPCSALTRCEICKKQCNTITELIVHVRKYHPAPNVCLSLFK